MTQLKGATWERFGIWFLLGPVVYFPCGRRHSLLQRGEPPPEAGTDPAA